MTLNSILVLPQLFLFLLLTTSHSDPQLMFSLGAFTFLILYCCCLTAYLCVLILCQVCNWKGSSPILQASQSLKCLLLWLKMNLLVLWNPSCQLNLISEQRQSQSESLFKHLTLVWNCIGFLPLVSVFWVSQGLESIWSLFFNRVIKIGLILRTRSWKHSYPQHPVY